MCLHMRMRFIEWVYAFLHVHAHVCFYTCYDPTTWPVSMLAYGNVLSDLCKYMFLCVCMSVYTSGVLRADSTHLGVFKAVATRVLEVLAGSLVAVGVQIDGAGGALSQELLPDLLGPTGDVHQGAPL